MGWGHAIGFALHFGGQKLLGSTNFNCFPACIYIYMFSVVAIIYLYRYKFEDLILLHIYIYIYIYVCVCCWHQGWSPALIKAGVSRPELDSWSHTCKAIAVQQVSITKWPEARGDAQMRCRWYGSTCDLSPGCQGEAGGARVCTLVIWCFWFIW